MQTTSYKTPWGKFTKEELVKVAFLGPTFMFIVALYWTLRSLKDPVFSNLVGIEYLPLARIFSFLFLLPLVMGQTKLMNKIRKESLFYIFGIGYFLFFTLSYFFIRNIDLTHSMADPKLPLYSFYGILGMLLFIVVESFGSLLVALFWSFATGEFTTNEGAKSFPIIVFMAQLGAIIGPTMVTFGHKFGIKNILFVSGLLILIIPVLIYCYQVYFSTHEHQVDNPSNSTQKRSSGELLSGPKMILSSPYLLGIFGISTLHEFIISIMDYQMKVVAALEFTSTTDFAVFMGRYGQCVNIFSLIWAVTGSSYLLRKVGVKYCLVLYPISVLTLITVVYLYPNLWVIFFCMVIFKMLNYALNNPAKEILYIPTDRETRYGCKVWIDAVGARSVKAAGAGLTNFFKDSFSQLLQYGFAASFLVGVGWLGVAIFTGRKFSELFKDKEQEEYGINKKALSNS